MHDRIWWHAYPLGLTGAYPASPSPDDADPGAHGAPLTRLTRWLDHAASLGCTGVLLGPVFASESHGYDTLDHVAVDPRLGTDADLDALLARARELGLAIVFDGVFSHVGRGFGPVAAALAGGPGSPQAAWVRWTPSGTPAVFEGHDALVALDHGSDVVADHVVAVLSHWLDRGIAGWRLDAAYAVDPDFWAHVLPRVRERHPDAWFLGEVIHGDYAAWCERTGVDTVTQYELWKAIWSSLADHNFFELDWTLRRHLEHGARIVPQTFVGNHDVTRIASRFDGDARLGVALALLLTLPGTPSIYAGDEFGLQAVKEERAGGDDAIRPAFPDDPRDWAELPGARGDVLDLHRRLIALRAARPWLATASVEVALLANERLVLVHGDGTQRLVSAYDLSGAAWSVRDARLPGDASQLRRVEGSAWGDDDLVPAGGWAIWEA